MENRERDKKDGMVLNWYRRIHKRINFYVLGPKSSAHIKDFMFWWLLKQASPSCWTQASRVKKLLCQGHHFLSCSEWHFLGTSLFRLFSHRCRADWFDMLLCLLSWSCWKEHTPQTVQNNCRAEDLFCLYEDFFFFINIGGSNLDSMREVELLRKKFSSLVF